MRTISRLFLALSVFVIQKQTIPRIVQSMTMLVVAGFLFVVSGQQTASNIDRDRGSVMLRIIKEELKNNYYDPAYHGMDLEVRFKASDERIKEATSLGQIFGIIAQTLVELEDSHTFFLPPGRSYTVEYGWQIQMIGEKCYVIAVKPGSDAEVKGLQVGDEVYSLDGVGPARANFWKIQYMYRSLRPQPGVRMVVIKPGG